MKHFGLMIAAALVAVPAGARDADGVRSVSIPTAGVRAGDAEAIAALRVRIDRAAREVCSIDGRTLAERYASWQCRRRAIEEASAQLDRIIDRSVATAELR